MNDQQLTDVSIMNFGKYKGKRLIDIPAVYFLWMNKEGIGSPAMKKYILENLSAFNLEASKIQSKKKA